MSIKREEGHNEVVEKVVKRLAKNNLYVKQKYKQKIREVGFLGVVIKLEGIKTKKEKIKEVLDQLILKEIKDIQKFLKLVNYY